MTLISRLVNPGIILWEIALMSSRFFWFHETWPARNSLLLLAVLESKVLHMNKHWATFSRYFFILWWVSKVFFKFEIVFWRFKGFLACCLMKMLLCHYLIPKECGDSKVLFSKLQLATYIYSIHYIAISLWIYTWLYRMILYLVILYEFILGYIDFR